MRGDYGTTFWQGIYAGLIGYFTVVILFAVADLLEGRPLLYVPALLGSTLYYGLRDPAQLVIWPGPIIAYNGTHLLVFLALGMIAAWLASSAERGPQLWYLGLVALLIVLFHVLAVMFVITRPVRAVMPMWMITGATLAATIAVVAYLLVVHPRLRSTLGEGARTTR